MARVAIVFGLLLCGLSPAGMIATMTKDPIQFVPLMLGIPILFCGVVGLNPHRRRLSLWTAVIIGLIGVVTGVTEGIYMGVQRIDGDMVDPVGWKLALAMTWVCAIFVAVLLVGLMRMRRARKNLLKQWMVPPVIDNVASLDAAVDDLPDAPVHRLVTDDQMPMHPVGSSPHDSPAPTNPS
jgi:hypothetical protein